MQTYLLSDRQDITRFGIEFLINRQGKSDIHIALNKAEIIAFLSKTENVVVIVDYTISDFNTPDELLILSERFPTTRFLLFSEELSHDFLKRILFSDAFSVVLKTCAASEITWALQCVTNSHRFVCGDVTNQLLAEKKQTSTLSDSSLTKTEIAILKEIALGKTTKEIASEKNLSFHTINTHRKNIFRKLEVNNVHEAIKYAIRAGIIDIAEYYI